MKSLVPWCCLLAAASQTLYASDGLLEYRQGNYFAAGKNLQDQSGKNPTADYYLGRMRLYGYGELKNNETALHYFTKSGEKGYLPAQQLLAHYYLVKVNDPVQALTWFKKAAALGDVHAQMFCAGAYLFGYGTNVNEDVARRYYIDAAKSGNAIAQYTLADHFISSRDMRSKKLGLIWLNKAVEKNDPKAQLKLGELYAAGSLVTRDIAKAQELMEKSAAQHYAPAYIALAELAQKEGNIDAAIAWLTRATNEQSPKAEMLLAGIYLDEKSKVYSTSTGFMWMLRAAQNGYTPAQQALSTLYKEGKVVAADANLAEQWQLQANKSAKVKPNPGIAVARWLSNDDADTFIAANYRLGGIYTAWQNPAALKQNNYNQSPRMDEVTRMALYKPQFTMANPKEIAINDYFDILAPLLSGNESNDWSFKRYPINAQIEALQNEESLVMRHPQNFSVAKGLMPYPIPQVNDPLDYVNNLTLNWRHLSNYQAALSQLYNQAILGESDAQYELGQLYQYGIAVAKNPQQAITYFELAALQQDVRAEYNLGIIYLEGQSNPVDYQKGVDWMTDAAFKGNPYAQYALANIYEKGFKDPQGEVVVQPDHQQAMAMYYLASSNHFGAAQYRLADFLVRENNAGLSVAARQNRTHLIKKLYQGAASQGVAEAVLPLAFYDAMESDKIKQSHAFAVAKQEAQAGNPEAALLLGIMYERGIATAANQEQALYWYRKASLNPVNTFILGTYYASGEGVNKDVAKGRQLLQQSADAGFSYANLNLAVLNQQTGDHFIEELEKARQKNNSRAGLLLADYYLQQADDPYNMKLARDIYQHFADKGDRDAQLKLAFLYDKGLGGEANMEAALQWYTLAAEQGQPQAQYLLGQMYQLGKVGAQPDYEQAKKWYTAAKGKYIPAAVALGFIFDTVEDDYLGAIENYQLAADANDNIGLLNAGLVYEDGKGQPVNLQKAEVVYKQAAEKGYAPAMSQLAGLYFRGINGHKDEQKALHWYKKAAALNDRDANYQLGLLSETGVATKLNFADAVRYYQQASDLGNVKATLALARMYQYGLGVEKDVQHAADLYKQLAEYNNGYAQYQLANLYLTGALGQYVPDQVKRMLQVASSNGSSQAHRMLNWMSAQQEQRVSFIEPVLFSNMMLLSSQPADLMYFDALSEWNRGDEVLSRLILNRLMDKYPHYVPAKRAYEQINQQSYGNSSLTSA